MGPEIRAAAKTLRDAQHVVILTGSGISAESGVPTFRDAQSGLWERYNPQDLATPQAFADDPALIWRWYRWRRELFANAKPNSGHDAIAALAHLVPRLTLITQNVDGLHQAAGSTGVIEFHGNIFTNRCFSEGVVITNADDSQAVPICNACGGFLRPGVVWFGEAIPPDALAAASDALSDCDVFLSAGTSSLVWPAAGLAETAIAQGATIIEVNIENTPISAGSDFVLKGKCGAVLPELINYLTV